MKSTLPKRRQYAVGNQKLQLRLRTLLFASACCAVVLGVFVYWNWSRQRFFHEILVGDTGPVASRDDWPRPLKHLLADSEGIQIDESVIQVHCLCQGFDPEFVWRMDWSEELFDHIKDRWKLTRVVNPHWHVLSGRSHNSGVLTPSWWSANKGKGVFYFACPQSLGGHKGDRFQVAVDEGRNAIFVHYWFNF